MIGAMCFIAGLLIGGLACTNYHLAERVKSEHKFARLIQEYAQQYQMMHNTFHALRQECEEIRKNIFAQVKAGRWPDILPESYREKVEDVLRHEGAELHASMADKPTDTE